jgi:hypothetical protein
VFLAFTEQIIPDAAEGAARIFDGGSMTVAILLAGAAGVQFAKAKLTAD